MAVRPLVDKLIKKFETGYQTFNRIEISSSNLLYNYDYFQKLKPESQIWPVLKSNAYGHGLKQVVSVLKERQFEYFIVDSYHEALKIWEVCRRKVLFIASIHPDNLMNLKYQHLTLSVQDLFTLQRISSLNKNIRIHLKINTGMNRQGIEVAEIPTVMSILKNNPKVKLEGVYSHLADADNPDFSYSRFQQEKFDEAIKTIKENGFYPQYIHLAATASFHETSNLQYNAARLGIGLYGINPLDPKNSFYKNLKPVLSFKSMIVKTHLVNQGDKIGYNCTYTAPSKRNIALIPVGYYEGLDHRLGNKGFVKYKNKYHPIIGKICMNMSIVDFGQTIPKIYDEIEIISSNNKDKNSLLAQSHLCQTIPYELIVHLNESVRRVVV